MAQCIPDRNWTIVQKALEDKRVPKDTFLAEVCEVYLDRTKDEVLAEVIEYIEDDFYRDTLMAFFLSGMAIEKIATFLRFNLKTLSYFEMLMVNPCEFRNKLDIFWYAEKYVDNCDNERGKQIVKAGIQLGPFGLLNQFPHGDEEIEIDTKMITRRMLQIAYTMTQLARGNPITSAQSKEALKWSGLASRAVKEAERVGADTTETDRALLAVEERKLVRSANEAGIIPGDILH